MSAQIAVLKFGGTSLEDGHAFQRVSHIVSFNRSANLVIVVSAMSGVTDALISSLQRAAKGEASQALQTVEYHFERHLNIAKALGTSASERMRGVIEGSRREVVELLNEASVNRETTAKTLDALSSHGERLSANLLTIVLNECGMPASYVDARRCIVTDGEHGRARPLMEATWQQTHDELQPLLRAQRIPVLGGFIAASTERLTTTLGRGSSDYSATLIGAALGAREIQIWTDVDGVMTADPSLVESARTVSQLSYEEAAELARLGARVLHAKMIQPVIEQRIPIQILNSRAPERGGTLISAHAETPSTAVKAIAHQAKLVGLQITSTPAFVANGFLGSIRNTFERHQVRMEIVATSKVGVTLACEEAAELSPLVHALQQVGSVETTRQRAIVSCVGEGLSNEESARKLHKLLREIDPAPDWHRTSNLNLISMVDADLAGPLVRQIHECVWSSPPRFFLSPR